MKFTSKYFSFETTSKSSKYQNKSSGSGINDYSLKDKINISNVQNIYSSNNRNTLLYFFENVTELNAPITYIGQKCSDISIKHVRYQSNGKEKDLGITEYTQLLNNPNQFDTGRTIHMNAISSYLVYGDICLNKLIPSGFGVPSKLYLLPGNTTYPIPKYSFGLYGRPEPGTDFRINDIIKYRLQLDHKFFDYDSEEIIFLKDSNLSFSNGENMRGKSRLYSAIRSIKTLSYIYDLCNTLIAHKGAEGFISKITRPGDADPAWDPEDRQNIEDKLYSYSAIDRPIGVSTKELKFLRTSVPISEFMPIELKEHEFRTICTALLFPSVLLNDRAQSIFNSIPSAEKAFYTDCAIPVNNAYLQALTNGMGLNLKNEALVADYSEIESLQKDKVSRANVNNINNNVCKELWESNLITKNEWFSMLGMPLKSDPNFNKLKSELTKDEVKIINNNQNAITDTQ